MWIGKYKWEWITAILQPIMSFTIFALCYFTVLCLVFRHFFVIDVLLSPAMVALIVKMIATTLLGWSSPTLSTSMISWKIKWNKAITNTLLIQSCGDDTSVQDWNSIGYPVHVYWNTGIKGGKECKESFLCPFLINLRPTILPSLSISSPSAVADPALQIRWRGGGSLKKNFFWPIGTHFGLKIRGAGPSGPFPWIHHWSALRFTSIKLLKAMQKGKKSKGVFEVVLGNRTRDISHRRPSTNQLC